MFHITLTFEQYNTVLTAIKKEIANTKDNAGAQELLRDALRAINNADTKTTANK